MPPAILREAIRKERERRDAAAWAKRTAAERAEIATRCEASFSEFRRHINPRLKTGWWQAEMAAELQAFYEDLKAGRRPRLVIQAPPQHGKSEIIVDFIGWLSGKNPDCRTIYASFSERLGIRANLRLQRMLDSERYKQVFPGTTLNASNVVTISAQSLRNREILEFVGRAGFFRNTTVRGSVTGEGLDLGVIDDPIKGREEANSETIRNKTWDWLNDDFMTRFSEEAGLLIILTRWHIDDPVGRLRAADPSLRVLSYPAIATADEPHRKAGEPLFPEHKSLAFLLGRKRLMRPESWESLYQQNPVIEGGNLFKPDQLKRHTYGMPPPTVRRFVFADTAQKTKEQNDYSVFQVWGLGADGIAYLLDQVRGKYEAPELEAMARAIWAKHRAADIKHRGHLAAMKVEDKVSGTGLIQSLRRPPNPIPVLPITRGSADKYTRALDALPAIAAGLVSIPGDAPFTLDLISELAAFPNGVHDDQVDPLVDAVCELVGTPMTGISMVDYL